MKNVKNAANKSMGGNSGNAVYFFGLIGSMVYWIQQASGFGEVIVAILKAFVWPAFVIYELLEHLV